MGRDGVSVAPGWRQGTANAATDNVAVGPRAANRDVPQSLRRPDLEERGYRAMFMEGPNGGEWVYALPESELAERRAKADADRKVRSRRRMETAAGVVGLPQAQGMSDDTLRDLIARNREAERQNKELQWRPRTMIRGGNAIGALALPGLADGQEAFILGGPTPLAVEAVRNQQLTELGLRVAQGRGFQDNSDMQMMLLQQRQREAAISRADQLIKRYPQGWDGKYDYADVEEVRNAVERQYPGMGDAAVAHFRVRVARASDGGDGGDGAATALPSVAPEQPGTTGLPAAGPAPPNWPIGLPWPPEPR